jgi:UrcA family protein
VETLYGRIHAAARRVCFEPNDGFRAYTVCVKKAQSDAVAKVNRPLLTELFQKKTGNHPQTFIANR